MNVWAIVAVIAALIFVFCMGYITSQVREKRHVDELLRTCSETSEALTKLSREYNDFVKSAQEIDRWPKHNSHIVMKDNLADYLKTKYFGVEEAEDYDGTVCEDEVDNLYV